VYSDKGYLTKQLVELLLEGIWCKGVYLLKISPSFTRSEATGL
jgi:hypothetical protein